jgi:AcrR family transcriptional regulator
MRSSPRKGIKALKIDRLCKRLGVTKGSFYWHFTDMAGYRAALVDYWGTFRDQDRRQFGELTGSPPRERLSQMRTSLYWARGTGRWNAPCVSGTHGHRRRRQRRAADQRVLEAVSLAFVDSRVRPGTTPNARGGVGGTVPRHHAQAVTIRVETAARSPGPQFPRSGRRLGGRPPVHRYWAWNRAHRKV